MNRLTLTVPADKSITHRAILFSALAKGASVINATSVGKDNLATLRAVQSLGVKTRSRFSREMAETLAGENILNASLDDVLGVTLEVEASGLAGLSKSETVLDCGNSGTTSRLICGILAGQKFPTYLDGDRSLRKRPFARVKIPLERMGAEFSADKLPLAVSGGNLKSITYQSPKASAQVKSAVILAGLYTPTGVVVEEPFQSRDHTERMLSSMGASISACESEYGWRVSLEVDGSELQPLNMTVPGDISSAAFLIAAALLREEEILIEGVGVNPSRTGFLDILNKMQAKVSLENERDVAGEPVADILVCPSTLSAVDVSGELLVRAIDEIPIVAILAAFADGRSKFSDAKELRVKESDRIAMVCSLLADHGIETEEFEDGFFVDAGEAKVADGNSSDWADCHDHRILMSHAVMQFALGGASMDLQSSKAVVETSYPRFFETLRDWGERDNG